MFETELSIHLKQLFKDKPFSACFRRAREISDGDSVHLSTQVQQSRVRKVEWLEARRMEKEIRENLVSQGVERSSIMTSVSHTRSSDSTWVIVIGSDQNVGVDLENHSRDIRPITVSRVTSPAEEVLGLRPLEVWVAKEAAFKSNPWNKGTVLAQYQIVSWDSATLTGNIQIPYASSRANCQFSLLKLDSWLFAFACTREFGNKTSKP